MIVSVPQYCTRVYITQCLDTNQSRVHQRFTRQAFSRNVAQHLRAQGGIWTNHQNVRHNCLRDKRFVLSGAQNLIWSILVKYKYFGVRGPAQMHVVLARWNKTNTRNPDGVFHTGKNENEFLSEFPFQSIKSFCSHRVQVLLPLSSQLALGTSVRSSCGMCTLWPEYVQLKPRMTNCFTSRVQNQSIVTGWQFG